MRHALTDEQALICATAQRGESQVVKAFAGCGKTSTLREVAERLRVSGPGAPISYMAFNKSVVTDAQNSFPSNVTARTAHGYAIAGLDGGHRKRLGSRIPTKQLAALLKIRPIYLTVGGESRVLQPSFLAFRALEAVRRYCQTADDEIGPEHFAYMNGIDEPVEVTGPDGQLHRRRGRENNRAVVAELLPHARRIWKDTWSSVHSAMPFEHGFYLKRYELGGVERNHGAAPRLPGGVVMLDEAQDLAPVVISIVQQQQNSQRIIVGDDYQSIYGFTGAENALDSFDIDTVNTLSLSWRFGPEIAELANVVLDNLGWDRVEIGGDFPDNTDFSDSPENGRLLYVAVTRGRLAVNPVSVAFFDKSERSFLLANESDGDAA
jgi:hypothetical protein